jgi:hypothetical protein
MGEDLIVAVVFMVVAAIMAKTLRRRSPHKDNTPYVYRGQHISHSLHDYKRQEEKTKEVDDKRGRAKTILMRWFCGVSVGVHTFPLCFVRTWLTRSMGTVPCGFANRPARSRLPSLRKDIKIKETNHYVPL